MKFRILIPLLLISLTGIQASEIPDGKTMISKMEDIMRGKKSIHSIFTMTVKRPRWDREMKSESWDDRAKDASFIRVISPARDAGTAFLKADGAFRQYIPRIRRTVRISKSMMLQSWMGSDFSNDDLARESSYSEDYNFEPGKDVPCGDKQCYQYHMKAKAGAAVVWPSLDTVVRHDGVPVSIRFYNARGEALKEMGFDHIKTVDGVPFPHHWVMRNLSVEGNQTILEFEKMEFDRNIPSTIFTTRNLTRGK